jgi:thiosulfate reductase/polysulfide reductase chain A
MVEALESLDLDFTYVTLVETALEPEPEKTMATHCYSCGALCEMTAKLKDGILTTTSGLSGDPKGGSRLCPKGGAVAKHLYSA